MLVTITRRASSAAILMRPCTSPITNTESIITTAELGSTRIRPISPLGKHGVEIHEYVEQPGDLHPAEESKPAPMPSEFDDEAGLLEDGEYEGVAT